MMNTASPPDQRSYSVPPKAIFAALWFLVFTGVGDVAVGLFKDRDESVLMALDAEYEITDQARRGLAGRFYPDPTATPVPPTEPPTATPRPADTPLPPTATPEPTITPTPPLPTSIEAVEEYTLPLRLPRSDYLDGYYAKLRRAELDRAYGGGRTIARLSYYGSSTIAADRITRELRVMLQDRFGIGGHGFILTHKAWEWYGHRGIIEDEGGTWKDYRIMGPWIRDKHYGFGGVTSIARGEGTWTSFRTTFPSDEFGGQTARTFKLLYTQQEDGGSFTFSSGREDVATISTALPEDFRADLNDAVFFHDTGSSGRQRFKISAVGDGPVRAYGVVVEDEGPGAVVDAVGILGGYAATWRVLDPEHLARQIRMRDTDLIVFHYGENMYAASRIDEEAYDRKYREAVTLLKEAAGEVPILLVGPREFGKRTALGSYKESPVTAGLYRVQTRVAADLQVGYYHTQNIMGGPGSIGFWLKARPKLVSGDRIHFTSAGNEILARAFYRSLMHGYERYLTRHPLPTPRAVTPTAQPSPVSPSPTAPTPTASETQE